jgi:NAD(P) transhydrogenase subunit beta
MSPLIHLSYLLSISLFMLGLKFLSSPNTARRGNILSMLGMFVAVVVTLLDKEILDYKFIFAGVIIGGAIGSIWAKKVRMTAMPQMVAIFNAFGGGASALVVLVQFLIHPDLVEIPFHITVVLSLFIGTITFTGSLVAFFKLEGWIKSAPVMFPGHRFMNILLLLLAAAICVFYISAPSSSGIYFLAAVILASGALGISLVVAIGGADMPVVIALLNSFSGLAASASGFVIENSILVVSGALVGASGIILTRMMSKAMNRSLVDIVFGSVGTRGPEGPAETEKRVLRFTPQDAAATLENAQSVIIVPGYGLAVARAQYVLSDTAEFLRKKGVDIRYAIHPVAGRMPGHMNVLLAEANVPYDLLQDIDEVNEEFQNTDVALVVGANDVINPAAREKGNPLSGMPILNVDQARTIIIIKRSLKPGFAGVENNLFYDPKTLMVFGDAKEVLTEILGALKQAHD